MAVKCFVILFTAAVLVCVTTCLSPSEAACT